MDAKKILVVDDQPHVRYIMVYKLKACGYEVTTASDGAEGLRAAAEFKPDLILSDFQMPIMNGIEMCRNLGASPTTSMIPIILITSRDFDVKDSDRVGTGIRFVRNKPFSPKDVLKLVERVFNGESDARAAA